MYAYKDSPCTKCSPSLIDEGDWTYIVCNILGISALETVEVATYRYPKEKLHHYTRTCFQKRYDSFSEVRSKELLPLAESCDEESVMYNVMKRGALEKN